MSTSNPTDRYHSLDFLRAVAMYLGVILHVTILFGSPDRILWEFYSEYYQDPVSYQVTWGIHLFRMQFFYLIAGFFAEMVYLKKGGTYFSKNRLKRILIPFLFGLLIIYPLTLGVFASHNAELGDKSYLQRSLYFFMWEFFSATTYNPRITFVHSFEEIGLHRCHAHVSCTVLADGAFQRLRHGVPVSKRKGRTK